MIQYQQFVLKGREHQETDDDLTHGKGESMDAHILVVEDDHDALRKIAYRLEYEGYRVTRASSGEAAIDLIEAHVFDVVLTDIVMEAVDGLEVMHTARQMNYRPAVILLTGHGSLESCIEALRSGAYDYLLKPCSPEQLLACVSGAVRRHQAEQQLQQAASILMGTIPKGSAATPSDIPAPMPSSGPPSPRIHQSMQIGKFTIGHSRHDVWFGQQPIRTTPIEYALLCYLAEHLGKQCHCCDIVRYTHGLDAEEDDAYSLVKSHIQNLRKKTDRNYFLKAEGKSYMLINPELSPALTTSHDHMMTDTVMRPYRITVLSGAATHCVPLSQQTTMHSTHAFHLRITLGATLERRHPAGMRTGRSRSMQPRRGLPPISEIK